MYYGGINSLKKAFGIHDTSLNWDRESIKAALDSFIDKNGDILLSDLTKANGMPSIPCILSYYPEYSTFSEVKSNLCGLKGYIYWDYEKAVKAGKDFIAETGKITEKDLKAKNGLPTSKVLYRLFGSLANYQKAIGAEVTKRNELIPKAKIKEEVEKYFKDKENRVVESTEVFFGAFPYSKSVVERNYGNLGDFYKEEGIIVIKSKKGKFSKREVDDAISNWISQGNDIPKGKDLTKIGLPSMAVILRYYENWKEPFYIYKRLYEEVQRNQKED